MSAPGEFPMTFEVLEQIFQHIPKDLKKLKMTCKRFYQVITSSFPLMKKFQVKLHLDSGENSDFFMMASRKFSHVNFIENKTSSQLVLQFVTSHALTLTTLEFSSCKFTVQEFSQMMFRVAETLEELCLTNSTLVEDETQSQILMPQLMKLTLGTVPIKFFMQESNGLTIIASNLKAFCCTESLKTENFRESFAESQLIIRFLRSQSQLEELEIARLPLRDLLLNSMKQNFQFQLQKITIKMCKQIVGISRALYQNHEFTTTYLPDFFLTQRNSLTHLILVSTSLEGYGVSTLLTLRLKSLELHSCRVNCDEDDEVTNETIEFLVLDQEFDYLEDRPRKLDYQTLYIVEKCRTLKSIEIANGRVDSWWLKVLADMELLTEVTLENCKISALHLQSVERLEVRARRDGRAVDADEVSQVIRMNPQLKSINVTENFRENHSFLEVSVNFEVEYNKSCCPSENSDQDYVLLDIATLWP